MQRLVLLKVLQREAQVRGELHQHSHLGLVENIALAAEQRDRSDGRAVDRSGKAATARQP